MNFRTKLQLVRLTNFILIILALIFSYQHISKQYKAYVEEQIKNNIYLDQKRMKKSFELATENLIENKTDLVKIHKRAIEIYKRSRRPDLNKIKKQLAKEFQLSNTSFDLYIVNKKYWITDSTISKTGKSIESGKYIEIDEHDLSIFPQAIEIIGNTFETTKIISPNIIAQDSLDYQYKSFSYGKVEKDKILAMSVVNSSLNSFFKVFFQKYSEDNIQPSFFRIFYSKGQYQYFKNQLPNTLNKIKPIEKSIEERNSERMEDSYGVINAFLGNESGAKDESPDTFKFYVNLFPRKINTKTLGLKRSNLIEPKIKLNDMVISYEVSLKRRNQFLDSIKVVFYFIGFFAAMIIWSVHIFIMKYFNRSLKLLVENIDKSTLVPLKKINENDEFFRIAQAYNTVYENLTQEIKKNEQLAYIDQLTGLGNRKAFEIRLSHLINLNLKDSKNEPFSILLFDIDNFKHVNYALGYASGDEVLIELSSVIKKSIRKRDSLYRVGGEEFAILMPETSIIFAKDMAENIRKEVEFEYKDKFNIELTVSIGVSEIQSDDTYEVLYKRIESLLAIAKDKGKNQVCSKILKSSM